MPCDKDLAETTINVLAATGGFLGGTSMLIYMKPSSLSDAVRRVIISIVASVMLTTPVAEKIFDSYGSEIIMGIAFGIGFIAWNTLGMVALFFENNKSKDIVQLAKDIKND